MNDNDLLITVTDPKTGGRVLLNNEPGDQIDRVGNSFLYGKYYVSSTPLEIYFNQTDQPQTDKIEPRNEVYTLRNVGDEDLSVDAVFTVSTESGRIVHQKVESVTIPNNSDKIVEYPWAPDVVGKLNLTLKLMDKGLVLTKASNELIIPFLVTNPVAIEKNNHVNKRGDIYFTPIVISANRKENQPLKARVYADGRLVGEKTGAASTFTVEAEPWFGYYDIRVDCESFSYEKRIVATVVETKGQDLLVNGEPFIVKGVNVHGLDSRSPERTASMMRIMRELGFNAWRGDYPARWQMELAYELNSVYTVLAPFSCIETPQIFGAQEGPALGTARELTRLFIERYQDSAGVLLWNSCNEVTFENIDFLISVYPLYEIYDPYQRPVHYANLYGQDLWQGQDVMGVNYYFGEGQSAKDRQVLIQRSLELAGEHGLPAIFCEYNSYYGAIHSTGVEAMKGLFGWGVEYAGMSGGFLYMRGNSSDHPGVMDPGYNTHKIYDEAIIDTFADAKISLLSTSDNSIRLKIKNKRRCNLREMKMTLRIGGAELEPIMLDDLTSEGQCEVSVPVPSGYPGPDWLVQGYLEFVTHHGFKNKIPISVVAGH